MAFRERFKQIIKLVLSVVLYYTGTVSLYRHLIMRNRAVILMYHRVTNSLNSIIDYSSDGMTVTYKVFEKQMKYLSRNYNVVSLNQLLSYLIREEDMPKRLCVITFDDGWKEVYDYAYPVLKKFRLPATIFLTTNHVEEKNWFWEERLKYLIARIFQSKQDMKLHANNSLINKLEKCGLQDIVSIKRRELNSYIAKIIYRCRKENPERLNSIFQELENLIHLSSIIEPRLFLNWREVKEMSQNGISFGAHTQSHCNLTTCSENETSKEVNNSKNILEREIDFTVDTFAYPYGKYDLAVKSIVKESGFICACSTESGFLDKNSDHFALKRVNIHNDVSFCRTMFACRILNMMRIY